METEISQTQATCHNNLNLLKKAGSTQTEHQKEKTQSNKYLEIANKVWKSHKLLLKEIMKSIIGWEKWKKIGKKIKKILHSPLNL